MTPIDTLFSLTHELVRLQLRETQTLILRNAYPMDQKVQLDMDRERDDIELCRDTIEQAMIFIASQN